MCTLALYFRRFDDFPLVCAANRDEQYNRPSAPPRLLDTRPQILAGKDLRAGGTWLGVNEKGLIVGILNRHLNGTIFQPTARSRGALCMDVLHRGSADEANDFIERHPDAYNPFTLLFADSTRAYVAHNDGDKILGQRLDPGLHVYSSAADFDLPSGKARRAQALFAEFEAAARRRGMDMTEAVSALQPVLADHTFGPASGNPGDAICVHREESGTVSSSLVFFSQSKSRFTSFYCDGPPCRNVFGSALQLSVS